MSIHQAVRLPLILLWVVGTTIAVILGILVSTSPIWLLLAAAAPLVVWLSNRYPPVTIITFWFLYLLQTTVFAGMDSVQGIYYPLYLLMGANCLTYFRTVRNDMKAPLSTVLLYVAFYGVVLISLFWQPPGVFVNTMQRLFIYGLGLLTVAQIRNRQHVNVLYIALIVGGLIVSGWTIVEARASFFAYRGGVGVNQNYVATLLGFGLIPLLAALTDKEKRWHPWVQVGLTGCFLGGTYAMLLLASRGVTAALLAAAVVILLRNGARTPGRRLVVLLVLGFCVSLLFKLPGSENLVERFSEADTGSFNERLPLWTATLQAFVVAPIRAQFLGHGMGASEILVQSINPMLMSLHNGYLQILYEFGLIGFLLFNGLMLTALYRVSKSSDYTGSAGTGIVVFMFIGCMSATMQDGFLFWIALGITFVHSNRASHSTGKNKTGDCGCYRVQPNLFRQHVG